MNGRRRDSQPRRYEFRIGGQLGEMVLAAFADLEAEKVNGGNVEACTLLRGELADQAALFGVLAQIQALGLELLEVRRLPSA